MKKRLWPPLERTGKKRSQHDVHNIKKYYRKMSLVFSKNPKNCQNEGVFEVAVMGWRECMNWEKYFLKTSFGSQICFKKRFMSLSVTHCLQLKFFGRKCRKKSWRSHFGDPSRVPPTFRFFPQKKSNVKRPQLSIKKKFGPVTDS